MVFSPRGAKLIVALVFVSGYLAVTVSKPHWHLPLFVLGIWVLWEWQERKRGISSFLSPIFSFSLGFIFISFTGWEKSPLLEFLVLVPLAYFLEGNLRDALLACFTGGSFYGFLGGWTLLVKNERALGIHALAIGAISWLLLVLMRKWEGRCDVLMRRVVSLEELVDRDHLTGVGNRRALQRAVSLLGEQKIPFVLAMIDLDCFKECNDNYGHERGDEVLKEFTMLLRSAVRSTDLVFRYGGDEFAVLFQEITSQEAEEVLQRVENKLENTSLGIGMSWGVAAFPEETKDPAELFKIADQRLYTLKKSHKEVHLRFGP